MRLITVLAAFHKIWYENFNIVINIIKGFPDSTRSNEPTHAGDVRDTGLIPGSGRSPGERNGNPLQDSNLENSMDRGAWQVTVHGVAESDTIE